MKAIIATREAKSVAARGRARNKNPVKHLIARLVVAVSAFIAAFACWSLPAQTQEARTWTAPNGAFSLTIPDMWNPVARSEPEVLLFLRSLGLGPSGPSAIACTVERYPGGSPDVTFTQQQLDALNQATLPRLLEHEPHPETSTAIVDGALVISYEAAQAPDNGLTDHHFGRTFVLQRDREVARYLVLCNVTTATPGAPADFAVTREFLASLHINPGAAP